MGLFTENGPFRPNPDGKTLSLNPFSWNNFTNMIYLEGTMMRCSHLTQYLTLIITCTAPAGVGFSFSDDPADYYTNDSRTGEPRLCPQGCCVVSNLWQLVSASDNYKFLEGWFQLFPQFKKNDFYVTGESYGYMSCYRGLVNPGLINVPVGTTYLSWRTLFLRVTKSSDLKTESISRASLSAIRELSQV